MDGGGTTQIHLYNESDDSSRQAAVYLRLYGYAQYISELLILNYPNDPNEEKCIFGHPHHRNIIVINVYSDCGSHEYVTYIACFQHSKFFSYYFYLNKFNRKVKMSGHTSYSID